LTNFRAEFLLTSSGEYPDALCRFSRAKREGCMACPEVLPNIFKQGDFSANIR